MPYEFGPGDKLWLMYQGGNVTSIIKLTENGEPEWFQVDHNVSVCYMGSENNPLFISLAKSSKQTGSHFAGCPLYMFAEEPVFVKSRCRSMNFA